MMNSKTIDDVDKTLRKGTLVDTLCDNQIRVMIKHVLEEWKNFSPKLRKQFKEAIKSAKKAGAPETPGFHAPERALERHPKILEKPLCQMARSSKLLAGMIVELWYEARRPLCDAALRFLEADPNCSAALCQARKTFRRGSPETTEWAAVRKDFAGSQNGEFPPEHIDLMLCCVADLRFAGEAGDSDSLPLNDWLRSLKYLPHEDSLWGERFDHFCRRIKEIGQSKHAAQSAAATLKDSLAEIARKFASDLAFLELAPPAMPRETMMPTDFDSARKLADALKKQLDRFAVLRRDEKEAETYAQHQPVIKKLPDAAQRVYAAHNELKEKLTPQVPLTKALPVQPEQENGRMETKKLRQQIKDLQKNAHADKAEIKKLRHQIQELQEDVSTNKTEIKKLRINLDTSRDSERLWRESYHEEMKQKPTVNPNGQTAGLNVQSVQDAFEKAARDYPDKLLVKLNTHSNLKKNRFEKPDDVLKALQWLAVFYRKTRMGGASTSNLDESLRQTCSNWFYSANQSEFAVRDFPAWYRTTINNKTYSLEPHIGTGRNLDERHTIRIAFDWDPDLKKVIVGFVGQHQRTSKKTS